MTVNWVRAQPNCRVKSIVNLDQSMLNPSLESDVVRIESLSFAYDTRPILHEVSLRIPRGKVVAIMGASGCGKTTLLRMIGGSIRPTAGLARVFGPCRPNPTRNDRFVTITCQNDILSNEASDPFGHDRIVPWLVMGSRRFEPPV